MKSLHKKSFFLLLGTVLLLATTALPASAQIDFIVPLKAGYHVRWIDRLDLSAAIDDTGQNFAEQFRDTFVQALDPQGPTPYFVDPTLAPHFVNPNDPRVDYHYIKVGTFAGHYKDKATKEKIQKAYLYANAIDEAFTRDYPQVFWLIDSNLLVPVWIPELQMYEIHYILKGMAIPGEEPFDIRQPAYRSVEVLREAIAQQEAYIQAILEPIWEADRYQQVCHLNHWLTHHNCYYSGDLSTLNSNQTHAPFRAISALRGSVGLDGPVCEGYANAFKVLCDRLGIPCVLVNGWMKKNPHIWNQVEMEDGAWYAVDTTLNDPVIENCAQAISGYEHERYLLVGWNSRPKGRPFKETHVVTNLSSYDKNSTALINGPPLSCRHYRPPLPKAISVTPSLCQQLSSLACGAFQPCQKACRDGSTSPSRPSTDSH